MIEVREPEAAVAILRTLGPDSTILLIRRAEREGDDWSGHWSLPGGRRDVFDPDPLQTAVRELEEECGIRLAREQMSAALPPVIARRRAGPFVLVAPYVFDIETELPTVLDAREAVGVLWLSQRTLFDPDQHSLQCVPGMPAEMRCPAIALPGAPLWGFTYRLLVDWLEIAPAESTSAGFDVARLFLDFLLSRELTLRSTWRETALGNEGKLGSISVAQVSGAIPASAVIDHFSAPGSYVTKVNAIEVRPDYVRIHGLAFEQYVIEAVAD